MAGEPDPRDIDDVIGEAELVRALAEDVGIEGGVHLARLFAESFDQSPLSLTATFELDADDDRWRWSVGLSASWERRGDPDRPVRWDVDEDRGVADTLDAALSHSMTPIARALETATTFHAALADLRCQIRGISE